MLLCKFPGVLSLADVLYLVGHRARLLLERCEADTLCHARRLDICSRCPGASQHKTTLVLWDSLH